MSRRAAVTAAGVASITAAAGVTSAAAAPPAPCSRAQAPTATRAWRAYLPPSTPVRPSLDADAAHARQTYAGAWRLVLRSARSASGTCLLRVRLSVRPNTASGWVRATRVRTAPTPWRIVVSRHRRTVTLLHAGRVTGRWRAVVGTSGTPTPRGVFAIDAAYRLRPGGFVGAWVLTLTAHSDVLTTFDGGDGRVALHGRGGASLADPLGTAASHGCVRLTDPAIGAIVHRIGRARVPGTPVIVR